MGQVAVVARHDVVEGVILIFRARRQCGRGKEQTFEAPYIRRTAHVRQVFRLAVGIGVALCPVVAVAIYVLKRRKCRDILRAIAPTYIVGQSATVDDVARLLCDVRQVRFQVEEVTAAAKFVRRVVFDADAAEPRWAKIAVQSESM